MFWGLTDRDPGLHPESPGFKKPPMENCPYCDGEGCDECEHTGSIFYTQDWDRSWEEDYE